MEMKVELLDVTAENMCLISIFRIITVNLRELIYFFNRRYRENLYGNMSYAYC